MKKSEFVCMCGRTYTLGIEDNSIVLVMTLVTEAERGPMPMPTEIEEEKGNGQREEKG